MAVPNCWHLRLANNEQPNMNNYPAKVRIVEVGPRDGLQNEKQAIDTAVKIELSERLATAGVGYIEAGSFVNPQWVPQMAGSEVVFADLHRQQGVCYAALTPNLKGYKRAQSVAVSEVAIFSAASEGFSQKNINCSIADSIERFVPVLEAAKADQLPVRGYVSCAAGCPYEGAIAAEKVRDVALQLLDMGCYEVSLGDTIGTGTTGSIEKMLTTVMEQIPAEQLAVHFHDTYGQALANIHVALQHGIAVIDTSVAGLGGCPYAKGASGNVATEDVVYMLNGMGVEHGIDLTALIATGNYICQQLGRVNNSKVAQALSQQY
jgi:hydroxymethylglutaryl-CoA lyase